MTDLIAYLNERKGQRVDVCLAMIPTPQGIQGVTDRGTLVAAFPEAVVVRFDQGGERVMRWESFQSLTFPSSVEVARSMPVA